MIRLPVWYELAIRELGQKEIPGAAHNARILEYHKATTLKATTDEVAWCSSFMNWLFMKCKIKGTNSAAARSWLSWGKSVLKDPQIGDVCIFWREDPKSQKGHVCLYAGETETHYLVLGGNQSDSVCFMFEPKSKILDIRQAA